MNNLPTPNWELLKHVGSGFAITVIITTVVGLGQALMAQGVGNVSWPILGTLAAGTFLGTLARLYPALIPQVEQAFVAPTPAPATSPVAIHVYPASGNSPSPAVQVEPAFPQPNVPAASWPAHLAQPVVPPMLAQQFAQPYSLNVDRFNASQLMPTVQPPKQ